MIVTKFDLVLLIIFHVTRCERRIVDGEQLKTEKTYVVYLLKATMSERTYDTWLCGGAIVSKEFIITSAACVDNARFMYAIAGYNRYVTDKQIEHDTCTREMKKKIVHTYVPVSYEEDSNKIGQRGYIDIALAKVESPYNFKDERYEKLCSYKPSVIPVNIEAKRQEAGVNAMVLGWGHTKYWRQLGDHRNYNQEYLHFGTTTLLDKYKCLDVYKNYPNLKKTIEKYMICSYDAHRGRLNEHGVPYLKNCLTLKQKLIGLQGVLCEREKEKYGVDKTRKNTMNLKQVSNDNVNKTDILNTTDIANRSSIINGTGIMNGTSIMIGIGIVSGTGKMNGTSIMNGTGIVNGTGIMNGTGIVNETGIMNGIDIMNQADIANRTAITNRTDSIDSADFVNKTGSGNISNFYNITDNRRNGICQNDHGGPLVTWVGNKEVLIGVASIFKIADDRTCIGPFLYSSTLFNGAFIGCVLNDERSQSSKTSNENKVIRKFLSCDRPPRVKGYDIIEKYLSWKDHPAGPADNERVSLRVEKKKISVATSVESDSEDVNPLDHTKTQQVNYSKIPPKKEEEVTKISLTRKVETPPITTPVPEMDYLSVTSPPSEIEQKLIISPSPEKKQLPIIVPAPSEMAYLSVIRPSSEMDSLKRDSPINGSITEMAPPLVIRPPSELEPLPIIRPPPSELEPPPIIRLPPSELEPLPMIRHPPSELEPLPIIRPAPSKLEPLPIIRPPPSELEPLPITRLAPEMDRLSMTRDSLIKGPTPEETLLPMLSFRPEVEPGPPIMNPTTNKANSILDNQSDESFLKEIIFGNHLNLKTTTQNKYIQPEIKIRNQRPLHIQ